MPSVMQTTKRIPAAAASRMAAEGQVRQLAIRAGHNAVDPARLIADLQTQASGAVQAPIAIHPQPIDTTLLRRVGDMQVKVLLLVGE